MNLLNVDDPIKIWLCIDIPENTLTGLYETKIAIKSTDLSKPLFFDVKINVLPYKLPTPSEWHFHLNIWQFLLSVLDRYNDLHPNEKIKPWIDAHFAMLETGYKTLAQMGQKRN